MGVTPGIPGRVGDMVDVAAGITGVVMVATTEGIKETTAATGTLRGDIMAAALAVLAAVGTLAAAVAATVVGLGLVKVLVVAVLTGMLIPAIVVVAVVWKMDWI